MEGKLKVSADVIKPFTGEGDVMAWLKKVKLVAKLQKITALESFMPLYLEGAALAIYLEMEESEQASAAKIEARLKAAFTDGPFVAYGKLVNMRWTGEQVDVYANEIRRLAGLAGFTGDSLEHIVRLTFVNGFPDHIGMELKQAQNIATMSVSDILSRARVLTANKSSHVAAVAVSLAGRQQSASKDFTRTGETRSFRGQCFLCGGPHMAKFCKERRPIVCFRCGKGGHIAMQCDQGNEKRGAVAPAATPSTE